YPSAGMKVLEIGTGSGYQTAILAHIGCDVFSIELLEAHVLQAKKIFSSLNLKNINAKHGNGFLGWEEEAPFDAIMVTAAPPYIPEKLIEQLKNSGTMIVPVGKDASSQYLKLITKKENKIIERNLFAVRFVPMVEQSASN
ncbi:MAG: methyltransferase domain-containing protein, partial [Treponema sp.]|nr:methyltransferase domain-containing protein [Treponema sp.]